MIINNIFTSVLVVEHLELNNNILKDMCIDKIHQYGGDNQYNFNTNEMKNVDCLVSLRKSIQAVLNVVHNELGFSGDLCQEVESMWTTLNNSERTSAAHIHYSKCLSGVYYVSASEDCGNIEFFNPNLSLQYVIPPESIGNINAFNSQTWSLKPSTGTLIIFPSWLLHYVMLNKSGVDRVSIAFDTVLQRKECQDSSVGRATD
jgi:uncharacterized protein (TIGR02466 family)